MKHFTDLSGRAGLAVAIASEEEDGRFYMTFSEDLNGAVLRHGQGLRERWRKKSAAISIAIRVP